LTDFDTAHGQPAEWVIPGEVIYDVDGLPSAMAPPRVMHAPMPHIRLTADQRATLALPEPDGGSSDV
jgi:hypothetical protein